MNGWSLIRASLIHHALGHAGVVAATCVAAAVLVGALVLGDCLQSSLERIALQRLGQTRMALQTHDRFFRTALADAVAGRLDDPAITVAPVALLDASASTPRQSAPIGGVQLVGVDSRFWRLGGRAIALGDNQVAINRQLAEQLRIGVGDTLVLRFDKPAALPMDTALADLAGPATAWRLEVAAIVPPGQLGRFALQPTQRPTANAWVNLGALGGRIGLPDRANVLLAGGSDALDAARCQSALGQRWRLADVGWAVHALPGDRGWQVDSRHVFLPGGPADRLLDAFDGRAALAYLANDLQVGPRAIPYAIVAAVSGDWFDQPIPPGTAWLTRWAADEPDLDASAGERLTLRYYVSTAARRLEQRSAALDIGRIVPMAEPFVDRRLMPGYPGLADAERQSDWDGGEAIDVGRIRPRDEAYWQQYRGSPKAYVSLETGRSLWANRFGQYTALRFDADAFASADQAERAMRRQLEPAMFGLQFQPVREQALAAARSGPASYFGALFVGLSFFLVAAAALLTALVFTFVVDHRRDQVGLLMAVGYTAGHVRRLLGAEGALLAAVGAGLGALAGIGYARLMMLGLETFWRDAIGSTPLVMALDPLRIAGGAALAWAIAIVAIGAAAWRATRHTPLALLSGAGGSAAVRPRRTRPVVAIGAAGLCAAAAVGLMLATAHASANLQAGGFIGAGVLMLLALLVLVGHGLGRLAGGRTNARRWTTMALRGAARRPGQSLGVVALLAAGLFLTLAVGANRRSVSDDPHAVDGPTGGYNLMVSMGRSLPEPLGRRADGSADPAWADVNVLPLRLSRGTEATCANLNRPAQPLLAGVDPTALADRNAFAFTAIADDLAASHGRSPWRLLDADLGEHVIPAIADQPTVTWALGLKVGQTLGYTDERGRPFQVRIVAVLEPSVLQGRLLVDAADLVDRYPSMAGYREFLVDTDRPDAIGRQIRREHGDRGAVVTPTRQRMARLLALENTYLSIFLMLGGLGLILGSVGVGVVVLRQVDQRRGELALLRAVGFDRRRLIVGVALEHLALGAAGMIVGTLAAALALWPPLRSGLAIPWASLAATVGTLAASLAAWVLLAAWLALRRPLLPALRDE